VLILSAEGGDYSNMKRLKKMYGALGITSVPTLWLCSDARWKFDTETDYQDLRTKISELRPEVVIVDPLVKFHYKDENSSSEMARILNRLRELIEDFGISIILIHHMGKNEEGTARGSSAILGEYDAYIQIARGDLTQKIKFDLRHTEPREDLQIRFNPDTYWFELANQNPLIKLVQECGEHQKRELVEKLVKSHRCGVRSTVYRKIDGALETGLLRQTERGTIVPTTIS
jgi:RecA-family ATPase